jgi:hypothetical protein
MNRRQALPFAFLPLVLAASACSSSYRGDGHFTDHGFLWGTGRYELDLGAVDLTRPGTYHYTLRNLPEERFAVGLTFGQPGGSTDPMLTSKATVRLQIRSSGGPLVENEEPLSEWIHSTGGLTYASFLYCKGTGDSWSEKAGTSWGCIFKPDARRQYDLNLQVLQPDSSSKPAILYMVGGPRDFLP